MTVIRAIIENITTFLLRNEIISILFLAVYVGVIISVIQQIWSGKCGLVLKSLIVILSVSLAFAAYRKVSRLMDTWLVLQISGECYATKNKNISNVVTPTLINEGGSANAYLELVRIYQRTEETSYLKKMIKDQLNLIYNNIERAKRHAKVEVCCHSNTQWTYKEKHEGKTCIRIEWEDDFDVTNVIAQLREPNYWQTRLTTAVYLTNKQYLEQINNTVKNFNLLKRNNFAEIMYNNLVYLIKNDPSLSVRKSALDAFSFWACLGNGSGDDCKNSFFKNHIFNFDMNLEQWKTKVIDNFNKIIGINVQNK